MKKTFGLFLIIGACTLQANAQSLRNNHFNLPVANNEIAFLQLDTVQGASKDDLYLFSKGWLKQSFGVNKLSTDDKEKGRLVAAVAFKIDDQNIKNPLYYTALVSIAFKDEVARINLHKLSYTSGGGRKEQAVNVTYQVKEQVRANTDELYPNTWRSLTQYGQQLLLNYKTFILEKEAHSL